jgi:hypothetical protein
MAWVIIDFLSWGRLCPGAWRSTFVGGGAVLIKRFSRRSYPRGDFLVKRLGKERCLLLATSTARGFNFAKTLDQEQDQRYLRGDQTL